MTLESNYEILLHASLSQLSNGRKARLRATSGVSFRFREQLCQVTSLVQRDEAPVKACVAAPSQVFMALDQFKMVAFGNEAPGFGDWAPRTQWCNFR